MERLTEGTEWETTAGYSRAVRVGGRIAVSGTTGHPPAGSDEPLGATYAQAVRALARALAAVQELGRGAAVVVRSRIYLAPGARWQDAARAHRQWLGDVAPANTTAARALDDRSGPARRGRAGRRGAGGGAGCGSACESTMT